jgi:putative thioredoxin
VAGQIADGFLGAMPEAQVREWLGQVMRVATQLGLQPPVNGQAAADGQVGEGNGQAEPADGGTSDVRPEWAGVPGAGEAESAFEAAQAAMERGDMNAAEAEFEKVLSSFPGDPVATMGLRQVGLIRRVESYDQVAAQRDAEERPDDAAAQVRVADIELAMGRIEASFQRLLDTIRRTTGDDREIARKHLISLFEIFPPRDPRVAKARGQLSSLLF